MIGSLRSPALTKNHISLESPRHRNSEHFSLKAFFVLSLIISSMVNSASRPRRMFCLARILDLSSPSSVIFLTSCLVVSAHLRIISPLNQSGALEVRDSHKDFYVATPASCLCNRSFPSLEAALMP